MKTKHKIALAKLAYHTAHSARSILGKSDIDVFEREGLSYELDLRQGIDFSIFLLRSFEPETRKALRRLVRPGDTVMDIGANIGAHTLTLASLVGDRGRVIACEPTDFAFRKLVRNIGLNPGLASRISEMQCFVSSTHRHAVPEEIYSGWPLVGGEDLHPKHLGTREASDEATCRSVDEIAATEKVGRVALIKMDVDGWECDVLSGATEVLARHKPTFVMEVAPYVLVERGASLQRFLSFFGRGGYRFYDERTSAPLPMSERELGAMIRDGEGRNVIAKAD